MKNANRNLAFGAAKDLIHKAANARHGVSVLLNLHCTEETLLLLLGICEGFGGLAWRPIVNSVMTDGGARGWEVSLMVLK